MSDTDVLARSQSMEYLSFQVGGEDYAIDIRLVREIRGWTTPSPMPDAPAFVLGVINLRGEVLPLLDLAARLGLTTQDATERNVTIVAEVDNGQIGLLVDAVSDIVVLSEDDMQPAPDIANAGQQSSVRALTFIGEETVRILDLEAILPMMNAAQDQT
ncbi:MAG: chemotaxis protein CheW [Paracoccaceae bacterium]|nr:chemotaxis protein CheW [Paracoccaceae bacterium]